MNTETVVVGVGPVTFDEVVRVARDGAAVALSDESLDAIAKSRARIEELATDPKPVYGVSTGFGALATRHIPHELRTQLQRSLIRSHAAGSGPEIEREVVRAMMLLRLSTLATGRTGVRPEVAQTYAAMLSAGLTPVVYEYGSLGCSGDLAPLAHVALSAIGEGSVRTADGELLPSADALARHGIEPVVLAEKEGLALINGTDGMLGMLVLALRDLDALLKLADVAAAMSVEGLLGTEPGLRRGPARLCDPIPGRPPPRPTCVACSPNRRSWPATAARTARWSRTPTRCAAHPRSRVPRATPLSMPAPSQAANWPVP